MDELKVYFSLLETASRQHDRRLVGRVANRLGSLRHRHHKDSPKLSMQVAGEALNQYSSLPELNKLFGVGPCTGQPLPTQEVFAWLLALLVQHDSEELLINSELTRLILQRTIAFNMRELDPLLARILSRHVSASSSSSDQSQVHNDVMTALRTCQLRHDKESMCTAHNCLARIYTGTRQWDMLDHLLTNSSFPADFASHNQLARHYYYAARLAAVQLDYANARDLVEQALRKAPADGAAGFKTACNKLLVVVQLLTGEIPRLSLFRNPSLWHYYRLSKAVRAGDLPGFQGLLQTNSSAFQQDGTDGLVLRLHQNVLKAGLRRIAIAYSRISIGDICNTLGLASEQDCIQVVMKAIRDGVIHGRIEQQQVFVSLNRMTQSQAPPADAFQTRIAACQALIQEAVKAMRFPSDSNNPGSNKDSTADKSPELTPSVQELDETDLLMDEDFF